MFDLIAEIRQTLSCNKLRSVLTGISVAWGVFMLIVLLGAARGVRNSFEDDWDSTESARLEIWGGTTTQPHSGFKEGRRIWLRNRDIPALEHQNHDVVDRAVAAYSLSENIYGPSDYSTAGIEAAYPSALDNTGSHIVAGRFINGRDMDEQRRSIVISESDATLFFGSADDAVGKPVRLMNLAWTVCGVYANPWRTGSYIPMSTYLAVTGNKDVVERLRVDMHDISTEEEAEQAEQAVRNTLAAQHQFAPSDRNALWVWNSFKSYLAGLQAVGYLNMAVWIIGLFTLLTGIVGVSNIMFVSVRERTHEIGIRRAIGAKPHNILIQVLAESVSLTALFGYIGIVAGMLVLELIVALTGEMAVWKNPTVDLSIAFEVTLALIVAGAVAGIFPALKAIKVKPVEALRDE